MTTLLLVKSDDSQLNENVPIFLAADYGLVGNTSGLSAELDQGS